MFHFRKAAIAGLMLAVLLLVPIQTAFGSSSLSFGATVNLSTNKGNNTIDDPHAIASAGPNVYVTWGGPYKGAQTIFFRASNDNGSSWGPVMIMSNDAGPNVLQKLAASGNDVYVTWLDRTGGSQLVVVRSSTDDGATFGPATVISPFPAIEPKIAACGSSVFVAWVNSTSRAQNNSKAAETMFFRASQNQGETWGPTINLQANDTVQRGNEQEVECYANNVYVVYSDWTTGTRNVFVSVSQDSGLSFLHNYDLSAISKGNIREPVIAVGGAYAYAYWIYRTSGSSNYQVMVSVSSNNGTSWGAPTNICNDALNCHEPFMAASNTNGSNAYVVLHEYGPGGVDYLYFRYTNNGGATWSSKVDLTSTTQKKQNSFGSITAVGSWVFITWSDSSTGHFQEYFTSSSDYGHTLAPVQNLSNDLGSAGVIHYGHQERAISASSTHVYVIWEDNTTPKGKIDLFFRAAPFS